MGGGATTGARRGGRVMRVLALLALLVLAACKVELYANLSEREANDMWAHLLNHGISANKVAGRDNLYAVHVDEREAGRAIDILRAAGFPRESFASIGDIFRKEGLISSPMEERVRFVYALSQELSSTISRIDGVLAARVHVVLPNNDYTVAGTVPSSAAVFIRYQSDYNLEELIPQIKMLVTNSIEGLAYDKVSVVLFPVPPPPPLSSDEQWWEFASLRLDPSSASTFMLVIGGLGLLCVLALAGNAVLFLMLRRNGGRAQARDAG
jgi:type III secretion protein J